MRRLSIGTAMVLALAGPAVAQSLRVSSATVDQPGHSADICVSLDSAGHEIAGTQNDLVWDGACATLERAESCRIAPDVDKELAGRIQGGAGFRYRAVVLSFEDVDPINDGALYCCAFRVAATSSPFPSGSDRPAPSIATVQHVPGASATRKAQQYSGPSLIGSTSSNDNTTAR